MYVIDTDALLTISALVPSEEINLLLEELVPLVEQGEVCFPDLVISELRRLAHGESVALWIRSVAGSRKCKSVAYSYTIQVLAAADSLLDEAGEEESSQVAVAAMALHLGNSQNEAVKVVTEDRRPLPTRSCLAEACKELGLVEMTALDFIRQAGLQSFLPGES
ncbi:hypothetical protein [Streptomyces sp. NBC_01565]|uniref:hypothetical protein n=1 Tax=Streptomyces sp. NBC_01565 TaxID=2975881 RepID=UPI002257FB4D|nr:hypothetical protein [Streptomyces sp. NBC_01565]MCX4541305.1 hypothetical protein [Streptomyces sp. NBC_01565]